MEKGKRLLGILLALILVFSAIPALSLETSAAPTVFALDPSKTIDNLEMLPAGAAERSDSIGIFNAGVPKYFWLTNFGANTTDYVEWSISSPAANEYAGWIHIETTSASQYSIEVIQGSGSTSSTLVTTGKGWEKAELDSIQIPTGESRIRLTRTSGSGLAKIKGIDIIKKSDLAAYIARVSDFKSDTVDFSKSGYGLFFQYGVWGYPEFGNKKSAEQATNDFDVANFVDMIEATGSNYIIWSLTWWQYRTQMPISAIDDIIGHSDFTTERNLVGEIAAECKSRDIDFYLYYHQGIQQEPTWKAKQNWPAGFTLTGTGDRETFFGNWESVISEIGQNLGTDLDGWYFDDGCTYWPAPFERLGAAAKAGNPDRLLAYNDWVGTSVTDFQENTFGEGGWGQASAASPTDSNGILTGGRDKGLLYAAMPMLESENWGIEHANQTISLQYNSSDVIAKVKNAMARQVPVSLNLQMWEDGRIGQDTLNLLLELKKGIRDNVVTEEFVNDNDSRITYSSGWVHDTRYSENHNGDIHVNDSPDSNPTVTFDFTGDGLDIIANVGDWGQQFKVYLKAQSDTDFIEIGQSTLYSTTQRNKIVVFSKKDLTVDDYKVKLEFSKDSSVTRPENHAQLDGFVVYNQAGGPVAEVPVSKINITAKSGTNTISNSSDVQMIASVLPQHATDKTVSWQVADPSGATTTLAAIDPATGMLTTESKPGFITVTCTSANGAGGSIVTGSVDLEIIRLPKTVTVHGNEDGILREGAWTIRGGSCDSTEVGASLSYDFEGEQIEWYGVVADDHGIAEVSIDGVFKQTVDCYAAARKTDTLLYKSEKLSDQPHNITIKLQGKNQDSSNYYIELYRLIMTLKEEPEIIPDPSQTLEEAKEAAETKLAALKVSNNTTENDIMSLVKSALTNDKISTDWSAPFVKVNATSTSIGRITGEIGLSENSSTPDPLRSTLPLGASGESFSAYGGGTVIVVDKEIEKLPVVPEPEPEPEPKTLEEAKAAAKKILKDYTFTNKTTVEEILQLIKAGVNDPDFTITIPADGFTLTPATVDKNGTVTIKIVITKGTESTTLSLTLPVKFTGEPPVPPSPEPDPKPDPIPEASYTTGSSRRTGGHAVVDKSPNHMTLAPQQDYAVSQFKKDFDKAISLLPQGGKQIVLRLKNYSSISSGVMKAAVESGKSKGVEIVFFLDEIVNNTVVKRLVIRADESLLGKQIGFDSTMEEKVMARFKGNAGGEILVVSVSDVAPLSAEVAIKLSASLQKKHPAIYRYDPVTKACEPSNIKYWIDANQYARFSITKGGSYIVMESTGK